MSRAKIEVMTVPDHRARRALWIALTANVALLAVEIVGGFVFSSLALLADATHLATDVVGLGVALVAQVLMTRPAAGRRTFGLRRAEALGAQANGLLVLGVTIWIVVEAIQRLGHSQSVDGAGLLAVATLGLVVNAAVTVVLARVAGTNLNLRAAMVHMLSDVAGSAGAMVAGIGILAFGATWLDPAASLAIAVLVAWSVWGVLRDTTNVFLEAAPRGVDVDQVEQALFHEAGVEAVHHLHVWEVASDLPALSAHVVLGDVPSLHDAQVRGDELKTMLADRFGITHTTLELECHVCDDPAH